MIPVPIIAPLATPIATTQIVTAQIVTAQVVWDEPRTYFLLAVLLGALGIAQIVGIVLARREKVGIDSALVRRYNHKLRVWWLMIVIFALAFVLHRVGMVMLFGFVSFWALREFITMTPTRRGDHRTLFWVFFIFTPLQYLLVYLGNQPPGRMGGNSGVDYYDYYSIMIPVYASLFIPARAAFAGDYKRFLERSAKIQAGLLICVYSLSYAPAILDLTLQQTEWKAVAGKYR